MRVGKARHWKDVVRMLTRGQTDRLSADSMLKYFQPLQMWLRVQNRDESVIGWNTNSKDTALFQSRLYNTSSSAHRNLVIIIISLLSLQIFLKE